MGEEKGLSFQERFDILEKEAAGTPLAGRVSSLRGEAERFNDSLQEVKRSPMSIDETVVLCVAALKEKKRDIYLHWLCSQMKEVQKHNPPFWENGLRITHFKEGYAWRCIFGFITEADLVEAGKLLEEDGLTEKERMAGMRELEKKISAIEADIKRRIKEYRDGLQKILA